MLGKRHTAHAVQHINPLTPTVRQNWRGTLFLPSTLPISESDDGWRHLLSLCMGPSPHYSRLGGDGAPSLSPPG